MKNTNISKKIIKWYDNNKRILPWRAKISNKKKEYYTLVSEFMLQQTQVKTVIPYFNNFILKIPDLESLSKIRNEKLMKCWEPASVPLQLLPHPLNSLFEFLCEC